MENNNSNGVSAGFLLFLVFLILKLTGHIDWSWWWVTSPLWIGFILGVVILGIMYYLMNK